MRSIYALLTFPFVIALIALIVRCLPYVGKWRVFEKGGEAGWKALIPFYDIYTMLKLGDKHKHIRLYVVGIVLYVVGLFAVLVGAMSMIQGVNAAINNQDEIINAIMMLAGLGLGSIVSLAGTIISFIVKILAYLGVCEKLGQEGVLVLGLIFLPAVFWMILGFDKSMQWVHSNDPVVTIESPGSEF